MLDKDKVWKMWETECCACGQMTPANKCPTLGYWNEELHIWVGSMCKPCWLKQEYPHLYTNKGD